MLQVILIVIGIAAAGMGLGGLSKGEIQFTKGATLTGGTAKAVGSAVIILGIGLVLFALFGISMLLD